MTYFDKAIIGGLVSISLSALSLIGVTGDMTVETVLYTLFTGLSTAISVYLVRNKLK